MTTILNSESGELFLYRSEKSFPVRESYILPVTGFMARLHQMACDDWFSTAERIKVAEGETRNFIAYFLGIGENTKEVIEKFKAGIEIPESCYEVKNAYMGTINDNTNYQHPIYVDWAYFKDDRPTEKETEYCKCKVLIGYDINKNCINCGKPFKLLGTSERLHEPSPPLPKEMKEHAIQFAYYVLYGNVPMVKDGELISLELEKFYKEFLSRK